MLVSAIGWAIEQDNLRRSFYPPHSAVGLNATPVRRPPAQFRATRCWISVHQGRDPQPSTWIMDSQRVKGAIPSAWTPVTSARPRRDR